MIQIAIERGQLALHFFGELSFLREGVILHVLRGLFCFCLDLFDLLRGGLFLVAAHHECGGREESNGECLAFHNVLHLGCVECSTFLSAWCATAARPGSDWPFLSEVVTAENLATALPAATRPAISIGRGSKNDAPIMISGAGPGLHDWCRLHDPLAMIVQAARLYCSSRGMRLGLKISNAIDLRFYSAHLGPFSTTNQQTEFLRCRVNSFGPPLAKEPDYS